MVKLAGVGAVVAREWQALSRRWEWYAARGVFVAGLLAGLAVAAWAGRDEEESIQAAARAGIRFFATIVASQMALVLLAAPAGTAGSICLEKARGTLAHLLVTDLSAAEIVLGKLIAHVVPVVSLVACGVPVLELSTLLGGVDPDALLGAGLIAASAAVVGCALALTLSAWGTRLHEVLMATYAVGGLWVGAAPGWTFANRIGVLTVGPPAWLTKSNPVLLTIGLAWGAGRTEWPEIGWFLAGCLLTAGGLTAWTIVRLRPVVVGQLERPAHGGRRARLSTSWLGPTLDRHPVLWREWRRRRRGGWAGVLWAMYGLLAGGTAGTMIVLVAGQGIGRATMFTGLLNGVQVAAGMVLLAVSATTSLAGERAQGEWEVLLATPLETRAIVLGKWWAAVRGVPWMAVPAGAAALAVACRSGRYAGAALVFGLVLSYGLALASLGLALATWVPHAGRAATLGVAAHILVTVGWVGLMVLLTQGVRGLVGPGLSAASPVIAVGMTTMVMQISKPEDWSGWIGWMVIWMFVEVMAAAGLLAATLATFERCLGRISQQATRDPQPRSVAGGS